MSPKRLNRLMQTLYWWRRGTVGEGWGFIAPMPASQRAALHNRAIVTPFHWQILAIVYGDPGTGQLYREIVETRSGQALAANDEHGNDQLIPLIEQALTEAEKTMNRNHIVDHALIMRPWSPRQPSMVPYMKMLRHRLSLTDEEIAAWAADEQETAL